jgi:hypothetical protein
MADCPYPDPVVQVTDVQKLARDLVVIPNRRVQLAPNIGSSAARSVAAAARLRSARHPGLTPVHVRSLHLPGQGLSAASGRIVARQVLAAEQAASTSTAPSARPGPAAPLRCRHSWGAEAQRLSRHYPIDPVRPGHRTGRRQPACHRDSAASDKAAHPAVGESLPPG